MSRSTQVRVTLPDAAYRVSGRTGLNRPTAFGRGLIAGGGSVTYSSAHATDGRHLAHLIDALDRDLSELRQMVSACGAAVNAPGRRPDVDADGTGRRVSSGPSRPTERYALDETREDLQCELNIGATRLTHAIAHVRGITASMDRALSRWEGRDESVSGSTDDPDYGASGHV
ncbi:DUF7169 domain-containing protein [Streptomyces albipurpureus]|uniref:DUF7169 domain-containing protein n=1 Tax=Streptomyces albipurpureus TaxID=2897419 RepID=UPI003CE56CA1